MGKMMRAIKRNQEKDTRKKEVGRLYCPKCHNKLTHKHGYGYICEECGWIKRGTKDENA